MKRLILCIIILTLLSFCGASAADLPESGVLNGDYTLDRDLDISNQITVSGPSSIDLNGHTLTYSGTEDSFFHYHGSLTISDSSEGKTGTIKPADTLTQAVTCFTVEFKGYLTLTGGTITGFSQGVMIKSGGSLTMSGGKISGNKLIAQYDRETSTLIYSRGAGVYIEQGASFKMSGGEISGNSIQMNRAGVVEGAGVYNEGTFTMSGGEIAENDFTFAPDIVFEDLIYEGNGAGLCMVGMSEGTDTVSAKISETASIRGNGFTNGVIEHLRLVGGGVYISKGSDLRIEGGSITGNKSNIGGGICNDLSIITMVGGTISGNEALPDTANPDEQSSIGGGIAIGGAGFTMEGGTISNNKAGIGAGVYSIISQMSISGDSSVTGNEALTYGGGVVPMGGTLAIGGDLKITGNKSGADGKADNLVLVHGSDEMEQKVVIDSALTAGAGIGVNGIKADTTRIGTDDLPFVFTTDYSAKNTAAPATYFISDDPAFEVVWTDDDTEAQFDISSEHIHAYTYEVSDKGDSVTRSDADGNEATLTISAPANTTSDGNPKPAVLDGDTDQFGDVVIKYKDAGGTVLSGAPSEPGTYTAFAEIADNATISVEFTITGSVTPTPEPDDGSLIFFRFDDDERMLDMLGSRLPMTGFSTSAE